MPGPHNRNDPAGQRQPPRSLLILPVLAILSITCLVFSEIEYLLPISRLIQTTVDETLPTRVKKDGFWLPRAAPLRKRKRATAKTKENRDEENSNSKIIPTTTTTTATTKKFDRIVLLGERHSGTSYTTRMLAKCFPDLDVSDFLVRYKHWFQPTPEYVVNVTRQYLQNANDASVQEEEEDMHKILEDWPKLAALENPKQMAFNRTLVIVMFRNAYDWLEAMRLGPHHWPNHFEMYRFENAPVQDTTDNPWYGSNFLEWQDFLNANMTLNNNAATKTNQLCQNAYTTDEVSPCRVSKDYYPTHVKQDFEFDVKAMPDDLPFNAHNPIYEMDPTNGNKNKPFADPVELRTAKMRNFLDIPSIWNVGGFMTLTHEDVNSKGSGFLLEQVSELMGGSMQATCEPDEPRNQKGKELDGDWQNWISEHVDWELEGRVGYQRRPVAAVEQKKKDDEDAASDETAGTHKSKTLRPDQVASTKKSSSFDRIVLLGERHSGTSYTTQMLSKCFPGLDVSDFLLRYKHWFQPTPEYVVNVTKTFLEKDGSVHDEEDMHKIREDWPKLASLEDPKSTAFNRTLVIVMFRNAYDWLEAMRLGPHHWSNHFGMYRFENAPVQDTTDNPWYGSNFLPWQDFLKANMTIGNGFNETHLCQNAYPFGSVSPCRMSKDLYPTEVKKDYTPDISAAPDDLPFNAHNPIYEMNPTTGMPFENPLELRTAKIRNFMDVPNMWDVGGFMTLQHEDVNSKGSGFLLDQVSKLIGVEPSCRADPPKNQKRKELDADWSKWISEHADWQAEGLLGYKVRDE